jgi:hypothetical protein
VRKHVPLAVATKMVNGGTVRVKQFCADHVAKGDYFPGCPVQVR